MQVSEGRSLEGITILCLGPHLLKTELLRLFLETRGGARAYALAGPGGLEQLAEVSPESQDLVLCDVQQVPPEEILAALPRVGRLGELNLALVGLDKDRQLERLALQLGVKGFFYLDDDPELLFKGLRTINSGQVWVSRRVLESCLMEGGPGANPAGCGRRGLTKRQEEVLRLLSQGYRNADIAEQLQLSTNTVKAHIYQAFRKINVSTRMQAARWTSYHLASGAFR
jgi:LuxR family transcriptional regulator of csgAB operon